MSSFGRTANVTVRAKAVSLGDANLVSVGVSVEWHEASRPAGPSSSSREREPMRSDEGRIHWRVRHRSR